ncbi:hypothetical protein [Streptomyces canus]|uniref:hypothetical protein n=1 Tax=Streptomyces canus TaxID=58343 RepID=UPI003CEEBFA8
MKNGTGPPLNRPQGHGITIRVYTVDRYGTVTGDTGPRFVPPETVLPARDAYPPCGCPRHRQAVAW